MRLHADSLRLEYDTVEVARDLSIEIPDGQISILIGPNGSGKSTLLRALSRLLRPREGNVVLDGKAIESFSSKEVARRLAILPQVLVAPEALTVEELVGYGRHPQRRSIVSLRDEDREAIDWALRVTETESLRHRPVDQLSGGQRQRVWIALVLAQGTDLILLDEPTTFLDISYQLEVLELLRHLNRDEGKTVVIVIHEINMAAEYADCLFALKDGKIVAQGPPKEILTTALIRDVFGIASHVIDHPTSGKPLCIPLPVRGETTEQAAVLAPTP